MTPPLPGSSRSGRILCFGGSFNPPHHGHLITARAVAERLGFDRVRLIVSASPPHKPSDPSLLPAKRRVEMTRRAVAGDHFFEVDDREARRAGPSYTIDTARQLLGEPEFADGPVHWLIGADLLGGLMTWHEASALLEGRTVHFVVMRRPGFPIDWKTLPSPVRVLQRQVVDSVEIDISATEIRQRVREGLAIRYLLPESVQDYIAREGLYR